MRSVFDSFVFGGQQNATLDAVVRITACALFINKREFRARVWLFRRYRHAFRGRKQPR